LYDDSVSASQMFIRTSANSGVACDVSGTLIDSVCVATGTNSAAFSGAYTCSGETRLAINNADLYATATGSEGLSVGAGTGCAVTLDLANSILRGGESGFDIQAFSSGFGGTAVTVSASKCDYVTMSRLGAASSPIPLARRSGRVGPGASDSLTPQRPH